MRHSEGMISKINPGTGMGYYETWDGETNLVVTNPDHVRKILSRIPTHALKGLKPASEAFFGKKVLFVLEGKEWRGLRKMMKVAFEKHNTAQMQRDTGDVAFQMADILSAHSARGEALDIHLLLSMYHLSATGKAAMDYDFKCIEGFSQGQKMNAINSAYEFMLSELPRRAFSPDPALQNDYETDNEDNRKFKAASQSVRSEVERAVEAKLEARKRLGKDGVKVDLLEAMIRAYEDEHASAGGAASELTAARLTEELGDNLVEILFAGYNTAVGTMANAIYFLAANPQLFARVQAELDSVLGAKGKAARAPTPEDQKKLKLLEGVVMETLRLVPPAAVIARLVNKDIELGGVGWRGVA